MSAHGGLTNRGGQISVWRQRVLLNQRRNAVHDLANCSLGLLDSLGLLQLLQQRTVLQDVLHSRVIGWQILQSNGVLLQRCIHLLQQEAQYHASVVTVFGQFFGRGGLGQATHGIDHVHRTGHCFLHFRGHFRKGIFRECRSLHDFLHIIRSLGLGFWRSHIIRQRVDCLLDDGSNLRCSSQCIGNSHIHLGMRHRRRCLVCSVNASCPSSQLLTHKAKTLSHSRSNRFAGCNCSNAGDPWRLDSTSSQCTSDRTDTCLTTDTFVQILSLVGEGTNTHILAPLTKTRLHTFFKKLTSHIARYLSGSCLGEDITLKLTDKPACNCCAGCSNTGSHQSRTLGNDLTSFCWSLVFLQ